MRHFNPKTVMYKIICKDTTITDCYVGSTADFKNIKSIIKTRCNNENDENYNNYVYRFIRNNGGCDNWEIIEIETYNAKNPPDQAIRKKYWFDYYKATLNKQIPSRTEQEYRKDYRAKGKCDITCECGSIYKNYKLSRHIQTNKHKLYLLTAPPIFTYTNKII